VLPGYAQDSTKKLLDLNNTKIVKKINSVLDSNQKKVNNYLFGKVDKAKETLNASTNIATQKIMPIGEERPLPYERLLKTKYTLGRRAYQNTMAQYNYFFNGEEELKGFIQNARNLHEDDFTSELISFYDYSLNNTAKYSIDSIIYRANANIVLHDLRNNWIDDSYLLLAKAYFFHKNFDTAASILQFINYTFDNKEDGMDVPIGSNLRNTKGKFSIATVDKRRFWESENVRNESMLWQARTYIETGELNEGISLLQLLKSDAVFPKKLYPFLNEQLAYGYYQMELYDSAANYLSNAIAHASDSYARSRWYYLIGQLWQKKENWQKAYEWYKKANETTVHPIIGVYSKINMIRIDAKNTQRPWTDLAAELAHMGKREKYSLFKDIIYFEMAKLAIQNKAFDKANDWLLISIKKNISNAPQKQKAFELLANINYQNDQYPISKIAYDSVTTILKTNPDFEQIVLRKKWMGDIVTNDQIIKTQDTLQYIYQITPEIQKDFCTKWIQRTKKENTKLSNLFLDNIIVKEEAPIIDNNQNNTFANNFNAANSIGAPGSNNANSTYYFDNPSSISQGKQSFIQKWGERPNVDDWRRKASTHLMYDASKPLTGNANDFAIKDSIKKELADSALDAIHLIHDSESLKASQLTWNNAALKNAQIFLNELNDYEKAYPIYKKIITKNINPSITERAMLDLASYYIHVNQQEKADSIIHVVESTFPKGFYISKRNEQLKKTNKEQTIIDDYKEAYFLSQIGNWDSLQHIAISLNTSLRGTKWYTPFQFLKVKMYAQQKQDSVAIVLLDSIILLNNNENIRDKAKNIIAEIKKRKDTESYLKNLQIVRTEPVPTTIEIEVLQKEKSNPPKKEILKQDKNSKNKQIDTQTEKLAAPGSNTVPIEIPSIAFTNDSMEAHYVAIVTHKTSPAFVKEMQNAFVNLNNDEFQKQNLGVTYVQFDADSYIVWIGPFSNLQKSNQYINNIKPRLTKEIISFVPSKQYELYLLGKSNIILIKNQQDLLLYQQFMFNHIYKP
jgi:hypothetical protein